MKRAITVHGITFRPTLGSQYIGEIEGVRCVVTNFQRGGLPWMVKRWGANLIALARSTTMAGAVEEAAAVLKAER